MAGRLHPSCPCPEEPVETSGVRANLQDHCFPIACVLETSPLPPTHSFLGLTSFLRWLGLHLLGFLAPNGAQRQHGDSTGAPCRWETVSAWVVEPWAWVWLSEVRWTQTAPSPPHVSRSPTSKGTCWQCLPPGFFQGSVWASHLRPSITLGGTWPVCLG